MIHLADSDHERLTAAAKARFTNALEAIPDLHLRKIFHYHNGVDAQFKYIPHESCEKWFCTNLYESELELYTELYSVLESKEMANIFKMTGDLFKHLIAEMLPADKDTILTIKNYRIDELESQKGKEKKVVLMFEKFNKGLVLGNKTGVKTLVKLFGVDPDEWVGKKIALYTTHVKAFGEEHYVIRIRDYHPKNGNHLKSAPVPSTEIKAMQTASLFADEDGEIQEGAYTE